MNNAVETKRPAKMQKQSKAILPRSMLLLSSLGRDNDLKRHGWYAVWCYAPQVRKRTVHHWRGTVPVAAHARRQSFGTRREVVVINGGYFEMFQPLKPTRKALIGSAGNGTAGRWSHGSPPSRRGHQFQRWAFGMSAAFEGRSSFALEMMESRADGSYVVPRAVEKSFPYGLSGLMCLLRDGKAMVWEEKSEVRALPLGQWGGSAEWSRGYYRRAALAWTTDGKHLFLVVHQHPRSVLETRDLFARYNGRRYDRPGPILSALRVAWERLPASERPFTQSELPQRIENAVLLDGGHSATLMYRRAKDYSGTRQWQESGSWLSGAPWRPLAPPVPSMIELASP